MELNFSRKGYEIQTLVNVKDDATIEERENIFASMMLSNAYDIVGNLIDSIDYERNEKLCNELESIKSKLLNLWSNKYQEVNLDKITGKEFK